MRWKWIRTRKISHSDGLKTYIFVGFGLFLYVLIQNCGKKAVKKSKPVSTKRDRYNWNHFVHTHRFTDEPLSVTDLDLTVEPHRGHFLQTLETERVELERRVAVFGVIKNRHRVVCRATDQKCFLFKTFIFTIIQLHIHFHRMDYYLLMMRLHRFLSVG